MTLAVKVKTQVITRTAAIAIAASCLLVLHLLTALSGNRSAMGISNWFVPDGIAVHEVLTLMRRSGVASAIDFVPEQFDGIPINPGLFLFYYPFVLLLGSFGYFVANLLCMTVAIPRYWLAVGFAVPYFALAASLPSKDIMVFAGTALFVNALRSQKTAIAALVGLLLFSVRDGAGVVVCMIWLTVFIMKRFAVRPYIMIFLVLAVAVSANYVVVESFGDLFIISRNLSIANEAGRSTLAGSSSEYYLLRLFGNLTNLAFRPSLLDTTGNLALLSLAYWISGISLLVTAYYSLRYLLSSRADTVLCVSFLTSLLLISLNPLVQPRYQLAFVGLMLVRICGKEKPSRIMLVYLIVTIISVSAAVIYQFSAIGLPPSYDTGEPVELYSLP